MRRVAPINCDERHTVSCARVVNDDTFEQNDQKPIKNRSHPGIYVKGTDPWGQIVSRLHNSAAAFDPIQQRVPYRVSKDSASMANASSVSRIERQTTYTILVSWSDPTLGSYVDQTWRAGVARTDGVCGLTGKPVRRGDPVFRPLPREVAPLKNPFDMILADTVPNSTESAFAGFVAMEC